MVRSLIFKKKFKIMITNNCSINATIISKPEQSKDVNDILLDFKSPYIFANRRQYIRIVTVYAK